MVQVITLLDGTRIYPAVELMPDGHNTFILKLNATYGPHRVDLTTINDEGVETVEPPRIIVN